MYRSKMFRRNKKVLKNFQITNRERSYVPTKTNNNYQYWYRKIHVNIHIHVSIYIYIYIINPGCLLVNKSRVTLTLLGIYTYTNTHT